MDALKFPATAQFLKNERIGTAMKAAYTAVKEELSNVPAIPAHKAEALAAKVALRIKRELF